MIGVGNWFRGDDAVGLLVAERVREAGPPAVEVVEVEGEPTSMIEAWEGASRVYVVDAVSSGGDPGAVYRFDALVQAPPAQFGRGGTHALSVAEVVELARALDRLPERLVVYGIEGASFTAGTEVTPSVRRAARSAADRVLREVAADAGEAGR